MGINYGFNKVRFVSPVKVGSRIRARAVTANAELKGNTVEVTRNFTVEIEGEDEAGPGRRLDHPHRVRLSFARIRRRRARARARARRSG